MDDSRPKIRADRACARARARRCASSNSRTRVYFSKTFYCVKFIKQIFGETLYIHFQVLKMERLLRILETLSFLVGFNLLWFPHFLFHICNAPLQAFTRPPSYFCITICRSQGNCSTSNEHFLTFRAARASIRARDLGSVFWC